MDETAALSTLAVIGWGALGVFIGAIASIAVSLSIRVVVRRRESIRHLVRHMRMSLRIFLMLLGGGIAVLIATGPSPYFAGPTWRPTFRQIFIIVMIFATAMLLTGLIRAVEDSVLHRRRDDDDAEETPHYRRVRTQMQVVDRVLIAVVWVCALAGALLTFPSFRAVGTSLIASAGLLSIVAGLAVQSSLSNIFAGMQIAFSDALRVGDLVVFNEQMGSVEEITLTYVVVRTWDDRRWIVPSSHFATQPFENWTRREPQLLGTVEFDLDWLVPVEAMRVELTRLVNASDLWDGRSVNLQVTESTGGHVRLRAVVSARTSGDLWDLRCYIREEMINWVQRHAVYALPRTRLEPETTPAPPVEEREEFVDQVVEQWEQEQSVEETRLLPEPEPEDDAVIDDGALPKWLQSWLVQRHKGDESAPEPRPAKESRAELTLSSTSPQARLYSGSPEAEERNRKLSGPSAADMAEREKTAERRLRTGEQPKVEGEVEVEGEAEGEGRGEVEGGGEGKGAGSAVESGSSPEYLVETHVIAKVEDRPRAD
ncbi:Small-conductance mechanosensitive channel [Tessaracoccus bendigoensis DSM 12906]|uniref:Small-conductance mechanosensitive channel n=1 Tax=Tessaracoccus bendigoensis DSM 12906 TaxID=1123357 RepID=A0A1M6GXD3_9ACTN|nr:mechanosensitive ion channel domain-containing protein [Tessaracoccus bendigoensis]SHJ14623.1 Small-conductance mechanosensitive channel [Tessaracoccus bendigoensis DSM 12906]